MSVFETLQNTAGFEEGFNGRLLKKTNGYLFTLAEDEKFILLYIHLPSLSRYQKKEIEYYIKSNAEYFCRLKFLKEGVKIFFAPELLQEPDYLLTFTPRFAEFLKHVNITFAQDCDEFLLNKDGMYVFAPADDAVYADTIGQHTAASFAQANAAPLSDTNFIEEYGEDSVIKPQKKAAQFLTRLSPTLLMFFVMFPAAVLFGILCIFLPQAAAAAGYLLGSGGAYLYIRTAKNSDGLFLKASLLSLALLVFFGAAAFFYLFLSQTELYTIFEYLDQTLTLQHCIFNLILGYILAIFGIYAAMPAKKKNKPLPETEGSEEPDDFHA